jgi:hypothetical protein
MTGNQLPPDKDDFILDMDDFDMDDFDGDQPPNDGRTAKEVFGGYLAALDDTRKTISDHKDSLLNSLCNSKPSVREGIWHDLVLIAHHYRSRDGAPSNHDTVVAYAKGVNRRLKKVLELVKLGKARAPKRTIDNLESEAILDGNDFLFSEGTVKKLRDLIVAAERITAKNKKPRGGQVGQPVPAACLRDLAQLYRRHTKKEPGAGDGPFAHFVHEFWKATGHKRKYFTVVADLKAASPF